MCEPTTIMMGVSAAISIISTVAAASAQQKQANAQASAISVQAQNDQNMIGLEQQQVANQAAADMNERNKQAMIEAATFDAITGEYGGGRSSQRQDANIAFNQNQDLASISSNRDRKLAQLGQEAIGVTSRARAGQAAIQRPSRLGTALTIAGTASSAYASTIKPKPQ